MNWTRRRVTSSWTASILHLHPLPGKLRPHPRRTYADDGDPLDVLVVCSESIRPLSLVRCYPIGVMAMLDSGKMDEKIIAIPFEDPTYNEYRDINELPSHVFSEMRHFFTVYKSLEGKETVVNDVSRRRGGQKGDPELPGRLH